jgi:plastocyanin
MRRTRGGAAGAIAAATTDAGGIARRLGRSLLAMLLAAPAGAAGAPDSVELVATRAGFKPKLLNVRKGETLRLRLRTADVEHCFALDAFRIEKRLLPGKTVSVEIVPERAGTYPYYCCLEPDAEVMRGRLVVSE